MRVRLQPRLSEPWLSSVELVREQYARSFDAEVMPDPDYFITAEQSGSGGIRTVACAGVTLASEQPFFSERYLDQPVDALIRKRLHAECPRDAIVEVGPLASRVPRAGGEVIRLVPIIAWCLGKRYILCTATRSLAVTLDRLGIWFVPFAAADVTRLPAADRDRWGRYYANDPQVGVIPLADLSRLFTETTGRYEFLDPHVELSLGTLGPLEVPARADS